MAATAPTTTTTTTTILAVSEIGIGNLIRLKNGVAIPSMSREDGSAAGGIAHRDSDVARATSSYNTQNSSSGSIPTYWSKKGDEALDKYNKAYTRKYKRSFQVLSYIGQFNKGNVKIFFYYTLETLVLENVVEILQRHSNGMPLAFKIKDPQKCRGEFDCMFLQIEEAAADFLHKESDKKINDYSYTNYKGNADNLWRIRLKWFICINDKWRDVLRDQEDFENKGFKDVVFVPYPDCFTDTHAKEVVFINLDKTPKRIFSPLKAPDAYHMQLHRMILKYIAENEEEIIKKRQEATRKKRKSGNYDGDSLPPFESEEGAGIRRNFVYNDADLPDVARATPSYDSQNRREGIVRIYWSKKGDDALDKYNMVFTRMYGGSSQFLSYLGGFLRGNVKKAFYYTLETLALENVVEILQRHSNGMPSAFKIKDPQKYRGEFDCMFLKMEEVAAEFLHNESDKNIEDSYGDFKACAENIWKRRLNWFICINDKWRDVLRDQEDFENKGFKDVVFVPYPECFSDTHAKEVVFINLDKTPSYIRTAHASSYNEQLHRMILKYIAENEEEIIKKRQEADKKRKSDYYYAEPNPAAAATAARRRRAPRSLPSPTQALSPLSDGTYNRTFSASTMMSPRSYANSLIPFDSSFQGAGIRQSLDDTQTLPENSTGVYDDDDVVDDLPHFESEEGAGILGK